MKRLLLILILTLSFQTLTKADDIRDFEIAGMSIGDSLLNYFSKKEIKNKINSYNNNGYIYNSRKFYSLTFNNSQKFKIYNSVQIILKDKDNKYKIHSIAGINYYESNINECYDQMEIIEKEFNTIFNKSKKKNIPKENTGMIKQEKAQQQMPTIFFLIMIVFLYTVMIGFQVKLLL